MRSCLGDPETPVCLGRHVTRDELLDARDGFLWIDHARDDDDVGHPHAEVQRKQRILGALNGGAARQAQACHNEQGGRSHGTKNRVAEIRAAVPE